MNHSRTTTGGAIVAAGIAAVAAGAATAAATDVELSAAIDRARESTALAVYALETSEQAVIHIANGLLFGAAVGCLLGGLFAYGYWRWNL